MKKFIITVDTEGDNLWKWSQGDEIQTENALFIPRFQELCEKYGFVPTYLTNYEMVMDERWVEYGSKKAKEGKCEIGMHIHAWNSPPYYDLENRYGGNPYITEYPDDVMEAKIHELMKLLRECFKTEIVSARSGRWATNEKYFDLLKREGIIVDCSVTPQIDLSKIPGCSDNCGNDYTFDPIQPFFLKNGLLEVPMTTRFVRHASRGSIKHRLKTLMVGENMWLRAHTKSLEDLIKLSKRVQKEKVDYLEFMIHSSELMPNGSPYFRNEDEIELLFKVMEQYFIWLKKAGYFGIALADYAKEYNI